MTVKHAALRYAEFALAFVTLQTSSIVGILSDEVDPLISVMRVEKAPLETYGDIGGLEKQIQVRRYYREFCILNQLCIRIARLDAHLI